MACPMGIPFGLKNNRATPLWAGVARLAALLCLGGVGQSTAGELQLELPIRCTPGHDCVIQNYVDHDPGPGWSDYACGRLSYDGHDGTDFRLFSLKQMTQGVEVLAAASGVVVGTRDGEPDVSIRDAPPAPNVHKEAGNGARIDHGNGWFTQYSHLRKGSLRVRRGQRVAVGEVLGLVGLSGQTEFPHVHFSVAKAGRNLDPFAPQAGSPCGATASALWSPAARARLAYQASGVLLGGFADRVLDQRELQGGEKFQPALAPSAAAIVLHVEVFGVRAGDVEEVAVTDARRRTLVERRDTLARDQAVRRVHLGKRRSAANWPAGEYVGRYVLRRGDKVVAESVVPLVVTP